MRVDTGLTRTQKDVRRRNLLNQVPVLILQFLQHLVSPDRVLAGPLPEGEGQHPGATSSNDPRPPGLEPHPGVADDDSMPRERPAENLQKPKEPTSVVLKIHNRRRILGELLKLHLEHYHMSPAQFRHRTSSLRLPEDIHELYKDVVQGCEHCVKKKPPRQRTKVIGLRADNFGDIVFIDHADVNQR